MISLKSFHLFFIFMSIILTVWFAIYEFQLDENNVSAICYYGFDFTCAVEKNNLYGVQFHPEKSHRFGMALMKKFIEL